MKNKKAQAKGLFGIFVYIFIALIVIIFFIIFSIHGCVSESAKEIPIKAAAKDIELDLMLISALQTPTPIGNANITLAEFGILTIYDKSYNDAFENQLKIMFEKLPYLYFMEIKKGKTTREFGNSGAKSSSSASIDIPSQDFSIVEFKLYLNKK